MKYLNYKTYDSLNGEGLRNTLWLSQCSHGCKGCFNKSSWGNVGEPVDSEFLDKILQDLDDPFITGLTLTGGDPLHKRNVQDVINLCKRVKEELPDKDIWLWTGYTLEQLQQDPLRFPILEVIDVLVDGKFEIDLRDITLKWRGSSNQRVFDLTDRIPVQIL